MTTEIEIKNICPVIGMISSGKSSILNALLNIDYLEAKAEVTTKMVTIIRYNAFITKPKFYQLKLKNEGNDNYRFYKENNTEIIGKDEIKKEIKKKNEELSQIDPEYQKIFYMLEIEEVKYMDKEFLKNYDLADVPGVSETVKNKNSEQNQNDIDVQNPTNSETNITQTAEERVKNINLEKEITYLTQIFKILKNKVKNGIFILNVGKTQLSENYLMIGKLKAILNKPIENFLILLNKMDKSENIENEIKLLNERFTEEFPKGEFNLTRNIIVQSCSFQIENELKMQKEFAYLLYFHYICYKMNKKSYSDFIDYLKNFLNKFNKKDIQNIEINEFKQNLESIKNDPYIIEIQKIIQKIKDDIDTENAKLLLDRDDFNSSNIEEILNTLNQIDEETVDLADITYNVVIILYFYYLYKNNKITFLRSNETKIILEYFTLQNINKKFDYHEAELKLNEKENQDIITKKMNEAIEKLNTFQNNYLDSGLYKNQEKQVNDSLKPIINILKTSKFFYIPLLGLSNAGKSTILNDLIGYDLLPVKEGQCTKKGILINHWDYDYPIIRKARFVIEKNDNKNDICYCEFNNDVLAEGDKNVRKILAGINGNFIEKEEDFFYIINVKIKYLDNFETSQYLKEKICFVDLPGYGTGNKFESKDIYSKFIKTCKLFLMVGMDLFNENTDSQKINSLLKQISKYQKISIGALSKRILFIINNSKSLDTSEKALIKHKKDLIENINALSKESSEEDVKDINITFFNGEFYHNYLQNKRNFSYLENFFETIRENHSSDYQKFYIGYSNSSTCGKTFEKYFLKNLIDNLKESFNITFPNRNISFEIDNEIDDSINAIISKKKYHFNNDDLSNIKKIISYFKNHIEECKYLNKSNFSNFNVYLQYAIIRSKSETDIQFRKLIESNLNDLDKIFRNDSNLKDGEFPIYKPITNDFENKLKEFERDIENEKNAIQAELTKNNVPKILEDSIDEVNNVLKNLKNKIEENLKKKKRQEIQKEFEDRFKSTIKDKKLTIIEILEACSKNIQSHYIEAFKLINNFKTSSNNKDNVDELKIYISNELGENNNYKEAIDNIVNDIVADSKSVTDWKNRSGFFDYIKNKLFDRPYLNKTIDYIISNAKERLTSFRKNISEIIERHQGIIMKKIEVERNNIKNILEENKKKEESENKNNEKTNQEYFEQIKNWKEICDDYEKIKTLINDIFNEPDVTVNQKIIEDTGTPNPQ